MQMTPEQMKVTPRLFFSQRPVCLFLSLSLSLSLFLSLHIFIQPSCLLWSILSQVMQQNMLNYQMQARGIQQQSQPGSMPGVAPSSGGLPTYRPMQTPTGTIQQMQPSQVSPGGGYVYQRPAGAGAVGVQLPLQGQGGPLASGQPYIPPVPREPQKVRPKSAYDVYLTEFKNRWKIENKDQPQDMKLIRKAAKETFATLNEDQKKHFESKADEWNKAKIASGAIMQMPAPKVVSKKIKPVKVRPAKSVTANLTLLLIIPH